MAEESKYRREKKKAAKGALEGAEFGPIGRAAMTAKEFAEEYRKKPEKPVGFGTVGEKAKQVAAKPFQKETWQAAGGQIKRGAQAMHEAAIGGGQYTPALGWATAPIRGAWNFLRSAWMPAGEEEAERHRRITSEMAKIAWLSIITSIMWVIYRLYPQLEIINTLFFIAGLLFAIEMLRLFGAAAPALEKILNFVLLIVLIPLGMRYFTWGVRIIHDLIPQFPIIVTLFALIAMGLSFITVVIPLEKWQKFIITIYYIAFVVILFLYPAIFAPDQDYNMIRQQTEIFKDWIGSFFNLFGFISRGIERELALASGDYFVGRVEEGAKKKLGVRIDRVGSVGKRFETTEKINTFATIRAESLGSEQNLTVNVKCSASGEDGIITPSTYTNFTVYQYEQAEIDCIIPEETLSSGLHSVEFDVNFDFETSAYLRTYLMRRSTIRDFRSQGRDPLDYYKITDKNPISVHTEGPVKIAIGTHTSQPLALGEESGPGPTFGITFENRWQGRLHDITSMHIIMPQGLTITEINGYEIQDAQRSAEGEDNNYYLNQTILEDIMGERLTSDIRTLRMHTHVNPKQLFTFEQTPLAIRNIKVSATYKYELKQNVEVLVRETL